MTDFLTLIAHGWTAFSFGATLAGIGGGGLIVLALLATAYLPAWMRRPLIGAGILLVAGAALFQAGQAKGSHDAFAVSAAETLRDVQDRAAAALAEAQRQADARGRIGAADKARADAAETAARDSAKRLGDLKRHLARTPDGTCFSADDARRLRGL